MLAQHRGTQRRLSCPRSPAAAAWARRGASPRLCRSLARAEATKRPLPDAAATYTAQEGCRWRCHHAWTTAIKAAADVSQRSDGFGALEGHNPKVKINPASLAFKHLPLLFGERGCLPEPSRGNVLCSGNKGINYYEAQDRNNKTEVWS